MKHPIAPKPARAETQAGSRGFPLPASKILIFTQDPSGVDHLKQIVEHAWEIPVVVAADPEHAFVCFHKMNPDLLVLDHAEAAHFLWQIRQDRRPDGFLPALVLVSAEDGKTKQEALMAGATDFLAKPVDLTEAMMRIHNLLALREARQQIPTGTPGTTPSANEPSPSSDDRLRQLRGREDLTVRLDRLHSLGTMASGIAHDFNNILMLIRGFADELLHEGPGLSSGARQKLVGSIVAATHDGAGMVERLCEFHLPAAADQPYQAVDLNHLVTQAVAFTRPKWHTECRSHGCDITVRRELEDIPSIHGHPTELREILTNLIFNAIDAMPEGGSMTLRTRAEGRQVVLEVADTGTGMTERVRRHCLEPFFTTKGGHGTGMGLPVVHEIVERHGATLEVESESGKGTVFRLRFAGDTPAGSEKSAVSPGAGGRLNILVVDDDPAIGDLVAQMLAADGHRVRVTSDPHEAMRDSISEFFDLVVTDQSMPLMNGEDLAVVIKSSRPTTRILLITGFGTEGFNRGDLDSVLAKPFTAESLRCGIAEAFASPPRISARREESVVPAY